jgi:hypothetical protein
MIPVWIGVIFFSVVAIYIAMEIPHQEEQYIQAVSDVRATSFFLYRKAVINHIEANPMATGSFDAATLAPFAPTGYTVTDLEWGNFIDTDLKLYVFSLATTNNGGVMEVVLHKSGDSVFVGSKTGGFFLPGNGSTRWALPAAVDAAIPDNAFVVIGK